MTEQNFQPGDKIEVTFTTEIISVRPDGKVLLRMVGMPMPVENIRKVEETGFSGQQVAPDSENR